MRNYSGRTLEVYRMWMRRFQTFVGSKSPAELDTAEVKEFLARLAVKEEVAASTQNPAFNALLFFYRHVSSFLGAFQNALDGPGLLPQGLTSPV